MLEKMLYKVSLLLSVALILLLSGCGTVNERVLLNKDGSGSVRLSLEVDKEQEEQVKNFLNEYVSEDDYNVKNVFKDFKTKKLFYIEKGFDSLNELGYDSSVIKIDNLSGTYVYTILFRNNDDTNAIFTNEELREFLIEENIALEFSITLVGHPLTKPILKSGNYHDVNKTLIPGSVTAVWRVSEADSFQLDATLPPMVTEWVVIAGILVGIVVLLVRFFLVKYYGSDATLIKFIQEEIVQEDELEQPSNE